MGLPSPLRVCFVLLQARGAFTGEAGAKIGGAEMQIRHLTRYLAASGDFAPSVIVEDSGQPDEEVFDGVTLLKLAQPREGAGALARARRKLFSALSLGRMARRTPADIFVQFCAGAETGIVARAVRRSARPFVYMLASDAETAPPWSAGGGLTQRLFRGGVAGAQAIIAQHEAQAAGVRRAFGREARVIASAYDFPQPVARAGQGVVWIGRCSPEKDPLRLLDLARRLPQVPFHLVAKPVPHEAELVERVEREAAELPNVRFTPGLPPGDIPAALAAASMLVNTSQFEGMPNTFLEAAGHGLALLALNVDPAGLFTREAAGVHAQGSVTALETAIQRLQGDAAAWETQSKHGREVLHARHALELIGPQFAAMLRDVAALGG